jgi:hypothetical protein
MADQHPVQPTEAPPDESPEASGTSNAISPDRLSAILDTVIWIDIKLKQIIEVHPSTPKGCIDSFPTRHDNILDYSDFALQHLLQHQPLGLIQTGPQTAKYHVITGLSTWRILKSHRSYSPKRKKKFSDITEQTRIRAMVYSEFLSEPEIVAVCHMDFWLKLAASYPDPMVAEATFVRAQQLVGSHLLKSTTPSLKSIRDLAKLFNKKSHSDLGKKRLPKSKSAVASAVATTDPEQDDSQSDAD